MQIRILRAALLLTPLAMIGVGLAAFHWSLSVFAVGALAWFDLHTKP